MKKTPEEINAYLLDGFFQDSKHVIPKVLRKIQYDKSDPEKVKLAIAEIWNEVFDISFLDMMMSSLDYTEVCKSYLNRINWWLNNFTLDYKRPKPIEDEQLSMEGIRNIFHARTKPH